MKTNDQLKKVTYGATHGDARLPQERTLCRKHDKTKNHVGYANVNYGYRFTHRACAMCAAPAEVDE